MKNYTVVVRRTDELRHAGVKGMKWGYNEGSRNGNRTAGEMLSEIENEASRAMQNAAYDVEYKKYEYDISKAKENKDYKKVAASTIKKGANRVMKILNNKGSGRLDDTIRNAVNAGKKWLQSILKKR